MIQGVDSWSPSPFCTYKHRFNIIVGIGSAGEILCVGYDFSDARCKVYGARDLIRRLIILRCIQYPVYVCQMGILKPDNWRYPLQFLRYWDGKNLELKDISGMLSF
jgi:hypothetical protein